MSWLAFTTAISARPPKFVSKPQMRWFVAIIESSCARRVLVVDVVAVHGDRVARLPVAHRRADAQHDAGGVAADHVVRLVVARAPHALAAEALQEPERRQRLEDRRPHRVEVDRRRHHRDVRLVGRELGQRELARRASTCAGPCPRTRTPVEHLLLVGLHERAADGRRAAAARRARRRTRPRGSRRGWRRSRVMASRTEATGR